jgi:hypothetical protein
MATNFKHKLHVKDNEPVYSKQFKIPETHQSFIEQSLDDWLKLGVVKRVNSLYNLPIFCVLKKQGHGQCQWIISPMGLLGCPASFQQLMEGVLRNIVSAIVYIDILLVHTKTQEDHLQVPEQVLQHLHTHTTLNSTLTNASLGIKKCPS